MNISQAKTQIRNAITAYFTKDDFGNYKIPQEKQRPIFLMGPPGIGKTAIMEQIAAELGVGLVSYSMAHHTRQSALGLPFIVKKHYGGKEYDVSEYTMSEIIASVYDMMEETGVNEGILFLDEINCVSETLAPAMLQFLQYKIFGRHKVPDGWIVVTAGNPPEYNRSVREFDIVTWDRLKRIDVEPDFETWKEYAYEAGVHPAILTYLSIKVDDFYQVESTVNGKRFVTARGWEDLSKMLLLYEEHGLSVDEFLVEQYIQNPKISKDFAVYYDLFNKYRSDYQIEEILAGHATDEIKERAKNAKFDERLSLIGLLLDGIHVEMRECVETEEILKMLLTALKSVKVQSVDTPVSVLLNAEYEACERVIERGKLSGSISEEEMIRLQTIMQFFAENMAKLEEQAQDANFALVKVDFDSRVQKMKQQAMATSEHLSNLFQFVEEVYADGQEMLILVTELTVSSYATKFIGRYGCAEYFAHNEQLMFYERSQEIARQLDELESDAL